MDDVTKTAEELDEKIYRKIAKKEEGEKYRDPNSKTSRAARRETRTNAKLNEDEHLLGKIRHDLIRMPNGSKFEEWLTRSLSGAEIGDDQFECHFSRADGAGGQLTNKKETAVICIHTVTGLMCRNEDTREQNQNKIAALWHLRIKVKNHLNYWSRLMKLMPDKSIKSILATLANPVP